VMATGYGTALQEERARDMGLRRLLLKPFTMSVLDEAIQEVLAEAVER